jgi:hypothetical protein
MRAIAMRLNQAPASTFTDVRGRYEKAPALTAWLRQAQGAVVNSEFKPTGASAINTRASLTPTHPGKRTRPSWQISLSPRLIQDMVLA